MLVILLPGYSESNREELDLNTAAVKAAGFPVYAHIWPHWQDPELEFHTPHQVEVLLKMILQSEEKEVAIVAKSIGTFVALHLAKTANIPIKKLILMGIPVRDLTVGQQVSYPQILSQLPDTEIALIQNTEDPHGSLKEVVNLMSDIPHKLVEKEANDHKYAYPEDVVGVLSGE